MSENREKILIVSVFVSFLFTFAQADAKIFDFLDRILGRTNESSANVATLQTFPILSAPLSWISGTSTIAGDIGVVQDSALLSVTGPLGSMVDVAERRSDEISSYVVQDRDTIKQIADLFDVSVNTIRWANDLKGNSLTPGQVLVILPVSGIQYTTKKGDTLSGIAKRFGGDTQEIANFNDLNINSELDAGMDIIIPNGEANAIPASTPKNNNGKLPPRAARVSGPAYPGYYIRPISGGRRSQGIHGYNAVDLANSCGTPIVASADGDVIIARGQGWNGGYGQYVVIAHANGSQTLYSHMSLVITSPGSYVLQGQVIGYVGRTGHATGCHIHFEIRGAKNPF